MWMWKWNRVSMMWEWVWCTHYVCVFWDISAVVTCPHSLLIFLCIPIHISPPLWSFGPPELRCKTKKRKSKQCNKNQIVREKAREEKEENNERNKREMRQNGAYMYARLRKWMRMVVFTFWYSFRTTHTIYSLIILPTSPPISYHTYFAHLRICGGHGCNLCGRKRAHCRQT